MPDLDPIVSGNDAVATASQRQELWHARIRDGLHTAMAPVGLLKGRTHVHDAVVDLDIATFLGHLLHGEVLPSLAEYYDDEQQDGLIEFADQVVEQFGDAASAHQLAEIATDSLIRWQANNLPVAIAAWERDDEAPATEFTLAAIAVLGAEAGFDLANGHIKQALPASEVTGLAQLRATFPGETASLEELTDWLSGFIVAADLFAAQPAADREQLTERLAAHTAQYAYDILHDGVKAALKATFG